jgi:dihydroflavonol-4-reductase
LSAFALRLFVSGGLAFGFLALSFLASLLPFGTASSSVSSTPWRLSAARLRRAAIALAYLSFLALKSSTGIVGVADLNSDSGWAEAATGCDYVLHVASPVPATDPKSDDELVKPARDGTLPVLKAVRDAGVKRVVSTSSVAAIMYGQPARGKPFTEADWTDAANTKDTFVYERSKTLAERAAWAWLKGEGGKLELTTINPVLVRGPVLGSDFSASLEAVKKLIDGSAPAIPRFGFGIADVRDVARLEVLAMTSPAAAGEQFIASSDFLWMRDMAAILKQGLGDKARKAPSSPAPDFVVRGLALFDPVIRGRLFELGKRRVASSDEALAEVARKKPRTAIGAGSADIARRSRSRDGKKNWRTAAATEPARHQAGDP